MSWITCNTDNSNRNNVINMNANRMRPANCKKFFGLFSPSDGTPANKLRPSLRDSANTSNKAPINAKFRNKKWKSHKIEYATVCRTTMKNSIPQAASTLNRVITKAQPPNCPNKFSKTNIVAKNYWGEMEEWRTVNLVKLLKNRSTARERWKN